MIGTMIGKMSLLPHECDQSTVDCSGSLPRRKCQKGAADDRWKTMTDFVVRTTSVVVSSMSNSSTTTSCDPRRQLREGRPIAAVVVVANQCEAKNVLVVFARSDVIWLMTMGSSKLVVCHLGVRARWWPETALRRGHSSSSWSSKPIDCERT